MWWFFERNGIILKVVLLTRYPDSATHIYSVMHFYLFSFCLVRGVCEISVFGLWGSGWPIMWTFYHWFNPCPIWLFCIRFQDKWRERHSDQMIHHRHFCLWTYFSNDIFIIIKSFHAYIFCHYKYLCKHLNPKSNIFDIPSFMVPLPGLLCASMFKFPYNVT